MFQTESFNSLGSFSISQIQSICPTLTAFTSVGVIGDKITTHI